MEKAMDCEHKTLINIELTQGKELADQLKNQLDQTKEKSGEICEALVEKILSSYEKALSMLKSSSLLSEEPLPAISTLESPHSFTSDHSPRSPEISHKNHVFKKRKALPRWSEQIQASSEKGLEGGPLGDGYSWRKYGQKDILGASFPRAYYRCTHRHAQGCLATKQVQKSDKDPSTFEITYKGRHSCNQTTHLTTPLVSPLPAPGKEWKKQKKEIYQQQQLQLQQPKQEHGIQKQTEQTVVLNFGTTCLKTEELFGTKVERIPPFSFPSTLIESENVENSIFPNALRENDFMGDSYSSSFISQETSESSYFPLSQCSHMNNFGSESDLTEIWSAPNSVTNSPMGDFLDFSLDQVDILEFFH